MRFRGFTGTASVLIAVAAAASLPHDARAAGAAYQVDTAEVSEPGHCKVESWLSLADNHDLVAAATPTCAFDIGRPAEFSTQFTRTRTDGLWDTAAAPKAKINLAPSGRSAVPTWRA